MGMDAPLLNPVWAYAFPYCPDSVWAYGLPYYTPVQFCAYSPASVFDYWQLPLAAGWSPSGYWC
uniref:Uncharacterized protein n=1 Tax=Pseudomonas phage PA_L9 TaxID=3232177 RepID=A0AAU8L0X1_9CAUD